MLHTVCNGRGHLYDDSSAPSLHGKNSENGAKEVKIKVFKYPKSRALKRPKQFISATIVRLYLDIMDLLIAYIIISLFFCNRELFELLKSFECICCI